MLLTLLSLFRAHEAKVKRAINKGLKERRAEWTTTLPGPWVEGATPYRHLAGTHVMFKSDAKKAFGLTEAEILTLPHESIPGSLKTYFDVDDARALQMRKFAAGALLSVEPTGRWRVLKATTSEGRRRKANFYEIHDAEAFLYVHWFRRDPKRHTSAGTRLVTSLLLRQL
ncbi:hypothetical protein B0H16DRAFT_1746844 [Mycena metata]|uniref:Uncharacterized protein n=1 Tax=Mycena metata TaxID=1033252 RepID=A0AAD7M9J5_9AGAR|nr:hypothetical protein B0H16DRAFT_1746844 [Mycena metata]